MNIMFWVFAVLWLAAIWFVLSPVFKKIGSELLHYFWLAKDAIQESGEEDTEDE